MIPFLGALLFAGCVSPGPIFEGGKPKAEVTIPAKASILVMSSVETKLDEGGNSCTFPVNAAEARKWLASTVQDFGVFQLHEIVDSPEMFDSDFLVTLRVVNHRVKYQGRNKWFWPNMGIWFLIWFPSWWIPDETFQADMDVEVTIREKGVPEPMFQKTLNASAVQNLNDLDRGWTPLAIVNNGFDEDNYKKAARHLDMRLWRKILPALADVMIEEFPKEVKEAEWTAPATRRAVVVGIGEEPVREDARNMAKFLAQECGFEEENITSIIAGWEDLLEFRAKDPEGAPFVVLGGLLDRWKHKLFRERDDVVFYFAGDGVLLDDGTPAIVTETGGQGRLRISRLTESLDGFGSSLILLDAGFKSGGGSRSAEAESTADFWKFAKSVSEARSIVVLAAKPGEEGLVDPETERGVCTEFVKDALLGRADKNADSRTTPAELDEYLSSQMRGYGAVLGRPAEVFVHAPRGSRLATEERNVQVFTDRALVVGIGEKGPMADAERVAPFLKEKAGFTEDNVVLVRAMEGREDVEEPDPMDKALTILKERMTGIPGDRERLFFYFAGKGAILEGGVPALVTGEGEQNIHLLPELLVGLQEYYELTVVVDAGFGLTGPRSATELRGAPDLTAFAESLSSARGSLVFASGPGDDSLIEESDGRSIFTSILLSALGGKADSNGDGVLSKDEISDHLNGQVKDSAAILGKTSAPYLQLHDRSWMPVEKKVVVRKRKTPPVEDGEKSGEKEGGEPAGEDDGEEGKASEGEGK
jgi:hypothetical protein